MLADAAFCYFFKASCITLHLLVSHKLPQTKQITQKMYPI